MNNRFIVNSSNGMVRDTARGQFINATKQDAAHIILNAPASIELYPKSLMTKHLYSRDNLEVVNHDTLIIDGMNYRRSSHDRSLFICLANRMTFNITTFNHVRIIDLDINRSLQPVLKQLVKSINAVGPISLKLKDITDPANLQQITSNILTIDNHPYVQSKLHSSVYIKNEHQGFDINAFKLIKSIDRSEIDVQALSRALTDLADIIAPKQLHVKTIFTPSNLIKATDILSIDQHHFYRYATNPYKYISEEGTKLNLNTFMMHQSELSIQSIAQRIKGTTALVYPKSISIKSILKHNNLAEVTSEIIVINKRKFHHDTNNDELYISGIHVFNITTFKLTTSNTSEINDEIDAQIHAQSILGINEVVYPISTRISNLFKASNLTVLTDPAFITVDRVRLHQCPVIPSVYINALGTIAFNIDTFRYMTKEEILQGKTPQEFARLMLGTDDDVLPTKSIQSSFMSDTLQTITGDEAIIKSTRFTRHPYYRNLFGTKNGIIYDITSFKQIDFPTLSQTIPFGTSNVKLIDSEHLFERSTLTINNESINWDNPLEVTPISQIRYIHPVYIDYSINFYGKPFHGTDELSINADTIYVVHDVSRSINVMNFVYECYTQTTCINEIETNASKTDPYRLCKWNLYESIKPRTDMKSVMIRHPSPRFNRYAYDVELNQVYSFYGKGSYIRMHDNYINITDGTIKSLNHSPYNLSKFKYECINQKILPESAFVIGNLAYDERTESFIFEDETFIKTRNPLVFMSASGKYFYTPYASIVPVKDDVLILYTRNPDRNVININDL